MALQKDTTTDSAVSANYYKIDELRGTVSSGVLMIKVGLYKSKTDRDAGASPVQTSRYSVSVDFSADSSVLGQAYTALAETPEFEEAADV